LSAGTFLAVLLCRPWSSSRIEADDPTSPT
jgi:hypothetical protein